MEDSRLLQQYEQVIDAFSRHKTLKAVHMAVAYCDWRVFEPLHAYPFRLCLGSIRENVKELHAMDEPPTERNALNLWFLLHQGLGEEVVARILQLLSHVSFSSYFTEKQHASAATLRRYHPGLSARVLVHRSYLHSFRQLLPAPTTAGRLVHRLHCKLERLRARQPQYITGRQCYYAERVLKRKEEKAKLGGNSRMSMHKIIF
eukprot:2168858-Amphidinium_carterae.1